MGDLVVVQHRLVSPSLTFHSSWGSRYREAVNHLARQGKNRTPPGTLLHESQQHNLLYSKCCCLPEYHLH